MWLCAYLGTVERTNGLVIHELVAWNGRLSFVAAKQTHCMCVCVLCVCVNVVS